MKEAAVFCLFLLPLVVDKQYEECRRISFAVATGLCGIQKKIGLQYNSSKTKRIHADYCRLCSDTINSWRVGKPLHFQSPIDLKLHLCLKSQTVSFYFVFYLTSVISLALFKKGYYCFCAVFLQEMSYFILNF